MAEVETSRDGAVLTITAARGLDRTLNLTFTTRTTRTVEEARQAWIDTYDAPWPECNVPTPPPRPLSSGTGWGRVGNRVVLEDGLEQTYSISWQLGSNGRVEWSADEHRCGSGSCVGLASSPVSRRPDVHTFAAIPCRPRRGLVYRRPGYARSTRRCGE